MSVLWQILIPTLKNDFRRAMLDRLIGALQPQLTDDVQAVVFADGGERSIGQKRQEALQRSTGQWVSMFDDDDVPAPDYVSRVLSVIQGPNPPDVVGFKLAYFSDGRRTGTAVHSYDADRYAGPVPRRRYNRLPNHLNPVRREIALRVGYKPVDFGEDSDYARRLAALVPRPVEAFIDAELYEYRYRRNRGDELTHARRVGMGVA